jgi:hypothetical protein
MHEDNGANTYSDCWSDAVCRKRHSYSNDGLSVQSAVHVAAQPAGQRSLLLMHTEVRRCRFEALSVSLLSPSVD